MDATKNGGGGNAKDDDDAIESGGYHHSDACNHRQYCSGVALKLILVFMVAGIVCLLLNESANPVEFFQKSYRFSGNLSATSYCDNHRASSLAKGDKELAAILSKAVMKDKKAVIITAVNAAWTEPNTIFDLFLESFRNGNGTKDLLKHVVVGAMDQKAYSRCLEENLHCYALATEGVDFSGEAHFMTEDYLKMVWRKIDFQRTVLEMGYDFIFTDADVMWMRNPFPRFYPDGDFQISCDFYRFKYTDLRNSPNSGFIYVKSNNRTIQFYNYWYKGKDYYPGKHDQDALNSIKSNPFTKKIGLEIRFLDTAHFGGFCQPTKDLDLTVTMHANCCVGMGNKIHDIKMVIEDWKKYMGTLTTSSWTVPRICH